ncbi:ROK family protein [Microbacterium sp. NPDC089321]|uniref:ROK family protein n=1 Tax=Microbacterium sp. NPDC089321 TaxID=3155183 RepID=UPI00341D8F76
MNVLGIDFGGTKVALRVEGEGGRAEEDRLRIGQGEPADAVLHRTFEASRRLVDRIGGVASVGVSTPGIVFDDRVDLAPNVAGWSELDLGARLRVEFGSVKVSIENDVKAAALAECREGALRGSSVGLYVNLGTGIAIAPVVDGQPLRGAHGAAGEVGYGIVGAVGLWDASTPTLEEYAGGSGLERRIAAAGDIAAHDVAELVADARSSATAAAMWRDAVDEIARHLITAALTVDPSRIAIGGGMTRAGSALLDPLSTRLASALPYAPEIVLSQFDADASLRGAVLLARGRS